MTANPGERIILGTIQAFVLIAEAALKNAELLSQLFDPRTASRLETVQGDLAFISDYLKEAVEANQ